MSYKKSQLVKLNVKLFVFQISVVVSENLLLFFRFMLNRMINMGIHTWDWWREGGYCFQIYFHLFFLILYDIADCGSGPVKRKRRAQQEAAAENADFVLGLYFFS